MSIRISPSYSAKKRFETHSFINLDNCNKSPADVNNQIAKRICRKEMPDNLRSKILVQEALKVVGTVPFPFIPRTPGTSLNVSSGPEDHKVNREVLTVSFSSRRIQNYLMDMDERSVNVCSDSCYVDEFYEYLRQVQEVFTIKKGFMKRQVYVTVHMRKILIDWLVEVQMKYKLLNETLFLTVSLLDRFLERVTVKAVHLQLVGVTALLIAAKYEEPRAPKVAQLVHLTDNSYTKNEVLNMELDMLKTLKFAVGSPLPVHFLRCLCKALGCNAKVYAVSKYIMELTLLDEDMVAHPPSTIAAASFQVANKALSSTFTWDAQLTRYSGYHEVDLLPVVSQVTDSVYKFNLDKLPALAKKYSSRRNLRVSLMPEVEAIVSGFEDVKSRYC